MKKYVFLLLAPFMLAAGLPSAEAALADSGLTLPPHLPGPLRWTPPPGS